MEEGRKRKMKRMRRMMNKKIKRENNVKLTGEQLGTRKKRKEWQEILKLRTTTNFVEKDEEREDIR